MYGLIFKLQRFSVYGTEGNDSLTADANGSYVLAYGGNDSVYNPRFDAVTIDAGAGNDIILNNYGYRLSIAGGYGNDSIVNYHGRYSFVDGGAGNDIISLSGYQNGVTINLGAGNDTALGSTGGVLYQFREDEGNDLIENFASSDTLAIEAAVLSPLNPPALPIFRAGTKSPTLITLLATLSSAPPTLTM